MRTKGAVSCVSVKLSDLMAVLKPDASVLVNRRFASQLGIIGQMVRSDTETVKSMHSPVVEEIVSFKEVE